MKCKNPVCGHANWLHPRGFQARKRRGCTVEQPLPRGKTRRCSCTEFKGRA